MEGGREAKYVLRDTKAAFSFISPFSCALQCLFLSSGDPVIKCVANLATGDTVCQVVRRRRGTHRPQIGKQILSVAEKRPPVLQMDLGSSRPLFAVLFCDIKERTLGALLLI